MYFVQKRIVQFSFVFLAMTFNNFLHANSYPFARYVEGHSNLLSFSSGYFTNSQNNIDIRQFSEEILELGDRLFTVGHESIEKHLMNGETTGLSRFLYWLPFNLYFGFVDEGQWVSNHEFGHWSRVHALGLRGSYTLGSTQRSFDSYFPFWWHTFSESVTNPIKTQGGSGQATAWVNWSYRIGTVSNDQRILVSAQGVNNSSFLATKMEEDSWYYGKSHIHSLYRYFLSKGDVYEYAANGVGSLDDIGQIVTGYYRKGINFDRSDVESDGLIAMVLSPHLWNLLYGQYRYLSYGELYRQVLEYYNFLIPNLTMYLNSQGPSYELNSGYKFSHDLFFPFSLEYVYEGETQIELKVGARKYFYQKYYAHGEVFLGEGLSFNLKGGVHWNHMGFLEVYLSGLDNKGLYGSRNTLNSRDEGIDFSGNIRIGGVF